jgi:hypothetical protein
MPLLEDAFPKPPVLHGREHQKILLVPELLRPGMMQDLIHEP